MSEATQPPGWYPAQGDPPGTVRWWDGEKWVGGPQQQGQQQQAGYVAPGAGGLANGRTLADPWLRIAAAIIDAIILGVLGIVIAVIFGLDDFVAAFNGGSGSFGTEQIVASLVSTLIGVAYVVVMNSMFSGTLGKMALGIRIVGRNGEEPLGWPLGIRRSANSLVSILSVIPLLGIIIGLALLVVGVVSLVFLFSDPEHRTVMDRFADTFVVKK